MNTLDHSRHLAVAIATTILAASQTAAAQPSALDLMLTADKRHRVPFERTEWTMVLQKRSGKKTVRRLEVLRHQDPADKAGDVQRVRFLAPGDVKDTRLLSRESKSGNDKQWVYFPAFRQKRSIGAAELGDRFAGTDFNYQDLKRWRIRDYAYRILRQEKLDGEDCYVIEAKPITAHAKRSPYARSLIWLRKDILFPVRLRHTDRRGRPSKQLTYGKLRRVKGQVWRADSIVALDPKRRHRTIVVVSSRQVPGQISADLFAPSTFSDR